MNLLRVNQPMEIQMINQVADDVNQQTSHFISKPTENQSKMSFNYICDRSSKCVEEMIAK